MDVSLALAPVLITTGAMAAAAGGAAWFRPGSAPARRITDALGLLSLALAVTAWLGRWRLAGHLPLFGTYESALSLAVAVLSAGLIARLVWPEGRIAWPMAGAVAAATVAHGRLFSTDAYALTISERSWVVDVHAVMAWAAFGCLAVNAGLALQRVVVRRPSGAWADRALTGSLGLGFLLHSAMLASGSLYKFMLFGSAWSFDPIETLGFVAWVSYGTLLHMHLLAGWPARRLAGWCLALFVILVLSYRGIVYFPSWSTYHIFDMDLRLHVTGPETPPR